MAVKTILSFSITGTAGNRRQTVTWSSSGGFEDPTGIVGALIALEELVCLSVTGPCFTAADHPPEVAFATAMQAFDLIETVDDPFQLQGVLDELASVPEGATA